MGLSWDRLRQVLGPLSPVVDGWLKFVDAFTWLVTRIVLIGAFFTIFLLYGVALRLIRKDPMSRTIDERDSYWESNVVNNKTVDEFKNMY